MILFKKKVTFDNHILGTILSYSSGILFIYLILANLPRFVDLFNSANWKMSHDYRFRECGGWGMITN